MILYCYDTIM